MKLIYLKSALKCDSFDVAIDIKIPFFRVLVTIEPGRSLHLQGKLRMEVQIEHMLTNVDKRRKNCTYTYCCGNSGFNVSFTDGIRIYVYRPGEVNQ